MSQIEELRELIVGANAEELAELKLRIEDIESRTRDVGEVLAPAIRQSDTKALVASLQDPVSKSLKNAIRVEPKAYSEILYPVMAPAIRRAISQAISSLLITINSTVESATSVQGIKARIQSMRTGVPYGELALRRSLLYRVEHAYLIARDSGMQIAEITSLDTDAVDGDAVSAMFSAIQNFVQDSFSHDRSAMLTDFKVGDHNVWVANGPKVMLACVIRGDAPQGLKDDLHDILYQISTDYAAPIAEFDGNTERFSGVEDLMEPLLQLQLKDRENAISDSSKRKSIFFIIVALVLMYFVYHWFAQNNKLSTVEYYLRQAPGVAATDIHWEGRKIVVEGLKDPDATIPYGALEAYGIDREAIEFRTIPFRSLEIDMELQRFRNELTLPSGVYLSVRGGEIYLYGEAPIEWLNLNDARIRQLAADGRLTTSALSASYESVSDVLRANFAKDDLEGVNMSSSAQEDMTTLQLGGTVKPGSLGLMSALFAGSRWVTVTAVQREVEGSTLQP